MHEDVHIDQPKGFEIKGKDQIVCKLKKSTYELKQASQKWHIKFNDTITSFGFKEIIVDPCIYLYYDNILLVVNDIDIIA